MKRIFLLALFLISISSSVFAVSLSELQTSPQFVKVGETTKSTYYLNQNSIKILRYSPPYYTLEYTEYAISYSNKLIAEFNTIANYNYNRSLDSLLDDLIKSGNVPQNATLTDINRKLIEEKLKNNGISVATKSIGLYDFNGTLLFTPSDKLSQEELPPFASPIYKTAQSAFKKVYNIKF